MRRPCLTCGTPTTGPRCPEHGGNRRAMTTSMRGYGTYHQELRRVLQATVDTGRLTCSKCRQPITSEDEWDLAHTPDRQGYLGPQHQACNRNTVSQ